MRAALLLTGALLVATAAGATAQTVLITSLTVEDIAWAEASGRLYAVLPAGTGGPESSVAELNPVTGAIVTRVAITAGAGGGATQLAISDDGGTLYVGVDGGRRVRRYAVPAFTAGAEFALGTSQFGDPLTARELILAPGSTSTLVIAQGSQFAIGELAIYDNGVARPSRVYGSRGWFFSPSQFFEPDGRTRLVLVPGGLQPDVPATENLPFGVSDIVAGVGYGASGEVYDFGQRLLTGTCGASGTAVPSTGSGTVYYFGYGEVFTCDLARFTVTGRLTVPGLQGGFREARRTGAGRFVLVDTSRRLLVADGFSAALPPMPPPFPGSPWFPGASASARATLTGCTRCRAGDLLVAQGAIVDLRGDDVEVKAAIVLPSGAALPVTALGTSHLELTNLFRDVGGTLLQAVLPAGLPPGTWAFELALIDPVTGFVLSRSIAPFEVLP